MEKIVILDKVIEFKKKMSQDYDFISVVVSELDNFGFVLLKHKLFPIEYKYQFNIESESWEKIEGKEMVCSVIVRRNKKGCKK